MMTIFVSLLILASVYGTSADCGGYLTDNFGEFSSPTHGGFVNIYQEGASCTWNIGSSSDKVALYFTYFDLEDSTDCENDYVQVFDNGDNSLGIFCGTDIPPRIDVTSGPLKVTFITNSAISGTGFIADYHTAPSDARCNELLTADYGAITPPRTNDGNYITSMECYYYFSAPTGQKITLYLADLSTETYSSCTGDDYLMVYDGPGDFSPRLATLCGTEIPPAMESTASHIYVYFKSDFNNPFRGYDIRFEIGNPSDKQIFTTDVGEIVSPVGEPGQPVDAEYHIIGSVGHVFKLYFSKFLLESNASCTVDYLEIFNGHNSNGTLIEKVCDFSIRTFYQYDYDEIFIVYHRHPESRGSGFHMFFHMGSDGCGGLLTDKDGSQQYPDVYGYENNQYCEWLVVGMKGETVTVSFTYLHLEDDYPSCVYDRVKAIDGSDSSIGTALATICDYEYVPLPSVVSSANTMVVNFESDSSWTYQGFNFKWEIEFTGCGAILTGESGNFSSNPKVEDEDLYCEFHIIGPFGNLVSLFFDIFDLEDTPECNEDFVEIRDGDGPNSPLIMRMCSHDTTIPIISITNQLFIIYSSSSSSNGTGVYGRYEIATDPVTLPPTTVVTEPETLPPTEPEPEPKECCVKGVGTCCGGGPGVVNQNIEINFGH